MQKPAVGRSDPQTTIAIAQQLIRRELLPDAWKRIPLGFPVNELSDSAAHGDQECAVAAFNQSVDFGLWHRIALRRTGLPPPQPGRRARPEIATAILVQGDHSDAETAVVSDLRFRALASDCVAEDRASTATARTPRPPRDCHRYPRTRRSLRRRNCRRLRSEISGSGIGLRCGGPGFHRHSPDAAPAQRLPPLSSYKEITPTPKLPSS